MKRISVLTTKMTNNHTNVDFESLRQKEMPFILKWREEGILENFYIRADTNGAILIFKDLDLAQVILRVESLPFFPYFDKVDYLDLNKIF
ncbi:MAG: hypothetical protein IPQ18_08820 [Saprospiraceae bacterium]|jgi:hypothetical protein|nr:hypothetical protein [Saprospiraceae bacterium]MBL0293337.1 hypothetical protein [Saprospiraceae bacterium]